MIVKNDKGRTFFVQFVFAGQQRGKCFVFKDLAHDPHGLIHKGNDPIVEIFEYRFNEKRGYCLETQFVADYYASSLAKHPLDRGIDLHGGVPGWEIDADAFASVVKTVQLLVGRTSMPKFHVRIDGKENTLTFQSHSGSRGYQYLTNGNASSHAFSRPLIVGHTFRTNGRFYEILSAVADEHPES